MEDRGNGAGETSVECTEKVSQPGRNSSHVIDVKEAPIKIGGTVVARLADNATARDLAPQLTLILPFKDFNHVDKVARLSRRLSTDGAPAGSYPDVGDIGDYEPWGDLVFYYP
jgi:hypothetical protein